MLRRDEQRGFCEIEIIIPVAHELVKTISTIHVAVGSAPGGSTSSFSRTSAHRGLQRLRSPDRAELFGSGHCTRQISDRGLIRMPRD